MNIWEYLDAHPWWGLVYLFIGWMILASFRFTSQVKNKSKSSGKPPKKD